MDNQIPDAKQEAEFRPITADEEQQWPRVLHAFREHVSKTLAATTTINYTIRLKCAVERDRYPPKAVASEAYIKKNSTNTRLVTVLKRFRAFFAAGDADWPAQPEHAADVAVYRLRPQPDTGRQASGSAPMHRQPSSQSEAAQASGSTTAALTLMRTLPPPRKASSSSKALELRTPRRALPPFPGAQGDIHEQIASMQTTLKDVLERLTYLEKHYVGPGEQIQKRRGSAPPQRSVPRHHKDKRPGNPQNLQARVQPDAKRQRRASEGGNQRSVKARNKSDAEDPLDIIDPNSQMRCYEVLGVARSAKMEEVANAYRQKARKVHPDKPGGCRQKWQTLAEAYEIIGDAANRQEYDESLRLYNSPDGLNSSGDIATAACAPSLARPDILKKTFLAPDMENSWPQLFDLLSNANLQTLVGYFRSRQIDTEEVSSSVGPVSPTIGLLASHGKYAGKIAIDNLLIKGAFTSLDSAIDSRISLTRIQSNYRVETNSGVDFEAAITKAVTEVRKEDQASVFYLEFTFEFPGDGDIVGRTYTGRKKRLTTPTTPNLDVCLKYRRQLIEATDKTAVHQDMLMSQKCARNNHQTIVKRLSRELPQMAMRHLSARLTQAHACTRRYKIISENRVGVLSFPDVNSTVVDYVEPGFEFNALSVHTFQGRAFYQIIWGVGWVPEYSRKDKNKKIVEHISGAPAVQIRLCDEADAETGDDSSGSSSNSDTAESESSASDSDS